MKTKIDELAIFGGLPEFPQPVHVGRPNTGNREAFLARVNQVLDAGYLTNNGPKVLELEERLADLLQVKHVVAVCNGTLALELLIRAMGLVGEVILPSLTFVATAHALSMLGITPVFCDVDPVTHNLDARQVERSITSQTTGILGVHLWGRACAVEELEALASLSQREVRGLREEARYLLLLGLRHRDHLGGNLTGAAHPTTKDTKNTKEHKD